MGVDMTPVGEFQVKCNTCETDLRFSVSKEQGVPTVADALAALNNPDNSKHDLFLSDPGVTQKVCPATAHRTMHSWTHSAIKPITGKV